MSSAAVVIMASEPGSGQAERLHPFFAAAKPAQNDVNEASHPQDTAPHDRQDEHSFPADQHIPIDPMMLAMDANATSYMANGHGSEVAIPQQGLTAHDPYDIYNTYPDQAQYQQQNGMHGLGQLEPTYTQEPQHTLPTGHTVQSWASIPPYAQSPTAVSNTAIPQPIDTVPAPPISSKPAPIPIGKNAFAMLQAKRKPVEKPATPAVATPEDMQTQAPEPKRRGRPPKKQKSAIGESNNSTPAEGDKPEPISQAPAVIDSPPPTSLIVKASAPIAPNAPNPLAMMMTKAANPAPQPKRLEVKYHYGPPGEANTARIAQIIDSILDGKHKILPSKSQPQQQQSKPAPKSAVSTPAKKAHPLFAAVRSKQSSAKAQVSGGSASKVSSKPDANKQYTSTPCSPKRIRSYQPLGSSRAPQFGVSNGILRVPGACLPAWPSRDNVHTRPDDHALISNISSKQALPYRKRKGNVVYLRKEDDLMSRKLKYLSISSVVEVMRKAIGEDFPPPPPELRLPVKHVESGRRLKSRISPQLRSQHTGLDDLSDSLSTTLSAFDKYSNEASMWTQKYAPSCTREVLQSGDEPLLLKNWLEALKVVAVDTGAGDGADSGKGGSKAKPKKKRKKNKMDGFIVSSDDDDDDDPVEESEDETKWTASGKYGKIKKTAVRSGNLLDKNGRAAARLNNVVVISGPHGSGKSASVYAVAKELGFEVFEISAGSRRTGKDVTDRIGNMTTNHLVQHKKKKLFAKIPQDQGTPASVESTSDLEDCDGDDDPEYPTTPEPAPSAKQQTMNSFFKPKASSASSAATPATIEKKSQQNGNTVDATPSKAKPGEQKQSLILLEEADILYEEDKQFWTTVTGLITQSKRPFVITCTDETLIPLRLLRLHAIFRYSAPPVDPCVDRLLLVAASEGHALKREAAKSLFEARDHDMRASLTDLQFWCQIAVGAKASRFDWFIPRQPAGADQDEHGHTTRVVSENTYWPGMGWLNHDVTISKDGLQEEKEDDFVQQAWNGWQLDMGQWQDSLDLPAWASQLEVSETASQEDRLKLLDSYCSFSETMSDADMVSHKVFATGNHVKFDATEPEHPPGGPDEYPIGNSLLDRTTVAHENDHLRLPMATSMRCLAKSILKSDAMVVTEKLKALDHVDAARVMGVIHREHTDSHNIVLSNRSAIARIDIAEAFDPIAVKDTASYAAASSLEPSIFDRNMLPIIEDVAPYVRSIIAHDERLKKKRQKLTSFLSEAATPSAGLASSDGELSEGPLPATRRSAKRLRTTRTAMSALEGGSRTVTRNGNWFTADINPLLVMQTAGHGWGHAADVEMAKLSEVAAKADEADAARAAALAAAHAEAQAQAYAFTAAQAQMVSSPMVPPPMVMPTGPGQYANIAPYPGQAAPQFMAYPPAPSVMAPMQMPYNPPHSHPHHQHQPQPSQTSPIPYTAPYVQHNQAAPMPVYDGQVYSQEYAQGYAPVYPAYGQFQVPGYAHGHDGAYDLSTTTNGQHEPPAQNSPADPTQQLA